MDRDNSNNRIYEKIDKIDDKLERKFDKVERRLDNVEQELVIYNEQLKHHIEGVKQARKQNDMLKEYIDIENKKVLNEFKPIKQHIEKVNGVMSGLSFISGWIFKVLGFVGVILGIYAKYKGLF